MTTARRDGAEAAAAAVLVRPEQPFVTI